MHLLTADYYGMSTTKQKLDLEKVKETIVNNIDLLLGHLGVEYEAKGDISLCHVRFMVVTIQMACLYPSPIRSGNAGRIIVMMILVLIFLDSSGVVDKTRHFLTP
jgi:hypothetical protein